MMDFLERFVLVGLAAMAVLIFVYMCINIADAWKMYKKNWGKKNDNEEKLKSMTTEELADFICKYMVCYKCPGSKYCYLEDGDSNGLQIWLKKEVEEE